MAPPFTACQPAPRLPAFLIRIGLILACSAAVLAGPSSEAAGPSALPIQTAWVTDGPVNAIAQSSTTVYLGGDFHYVGPATGGFAVLNQSSGAVAAPWARVDGPVLAMAPDGSGGWYIGGNFNNVG